VFIETKISGKKKKYYLVHSFRHDGKVKKIRKYLGTGLSSKKLEEIKPIAERQILDRINALKRISDPLLQALSDEEINEIRKLEDKKGFRIFHLSEDEWKRFSKIFTYNTNAIEGSELDQKEVREILEKNEWPKEKSREALSEAYGVAEAVKFIRQTKEHVSIGLIKKIHEVIFKNSKSYAGCLRPKGTEVAVTNSLKIVVHEGAPSEKVPELLKELVEWYEKYSKKYPPIVLAAVVHNQFENIRPFQDGNGRVSRILMNNVLLKHGLPPINIDFAKRREYYASLQEYEKNHDLQPTIELMFDEYKELRKKLRGATKRKK